MLKALLIALVVWSAAAGGKAKEAELNLHARECFLRSSFTPSNEMSSLSYDALRASAFGARSPQLRVWAVLEDILINGTIIEGTIAVRLNQTCDTALSAVRERMERLTPEFRDSVAGAQLIETNTNWREISSNEFARINLTPLPSPR